MAKPVLNRTHSFLPSILLCLLPLLLTTCSDDSVTTLPLAPQFADLGDPGTLGDRVWNDTNGNGIQDSGEAGIEGIQVNLWLAGDLILKAETDAAGAYSFTGLEAGITYEVEFVKPDGYRFSPQNAGTDPAVDSDAEFVTGRVSVSLASGESDITIDAGMYAYGSATGLVWDDTDHDGIQEEDEPPLEGIEVHLLYTHIGSRQTFTDENGVYRFDNLEPSKGHHANVMYRLGFRLPEGGDHVFSPEDRGDDDAVDSDADEDGLTHWFEVYPGETMEDIDAGMFDARTSVGDRVWNDLNKDGIQDEGEPGIEGVTVYLWDLTAFPSPSREEATTDALGNYLFEDLRWSDPEPHGGGPRYPYEIEFVLPEDTWFSPRGEGDDGEADSDASELDSRTGVFFLYAGQHRTDMDAGMFDAWADLRGQVWNDENMDGIQDPGEDGLLDVTVILEEQWGDRHTYHDDTDHHGNYSFRDLQWTEPDGEPYRYKLTFLLEEGHAFSPRHAGTSPARDSDADSDGETDDFTLAPGEVQRDLDAGMYDGRAAIRGRVWEDLDVDGYRDGGEPDPDDAPHVLLHELWSGTTHTTTATGGWYDFDGLQWTTEGEGPYEYQLEFVPAPGYRLTGQHQGGDPSRDSDPDADGWTEAFTLAPQEIKRDIDAGVWLVESGSIGDRVWEDLNFNGVQDPEEPGVGGVRVVLYGSAAGGQVDETVTSPDGSYLFAGLGTMRTHEGGVPTAYMVCFEAPSGYDLTDPNVGADEALDSDAASEFGCESNYRGLFPYQNVNSVDAGLIDMNSGSIGDRVWEDLNSNGIQDPEEPGVGGVRVALYESGSGARVAETETPPDGSYLFSGLRNVLPRGGGGATAYMVCFEAPPGFVLTDADVGTDEALDSDAASEFGCESNYRGLFPYQYVDYVDAGLINLNSATIGDWVWNDLNRNGVQDDGEPGVGGVTVELFAVSGPSLSPYASTLTDGNGFFGFSDLPGSVDLDDLRKYRIQFTPKDGYSFTPRDQGGDDARDSDADPASGLTHELIIDAYEIDETVDAGLFASGTIRVLKETEPTGGTGFTFSVTGKDPAGNQLDLGTSALDDQGEWLLAAAPVGRYQITEEDPGPEYLLSKITCSPGVPEGNLETRTVGFDLEAGGTVECTFVNQSTGTIRIRKETVPEGRTGFHFEHDIGEGGTFQLDDAGVETFFHVPAGDYQVHEVALPPFHELKNVVCSEGEGVRESSWDPESGVVTIALDPGETVDCTFTNEDLEPHFQARPETQTVQYSDQIQTVLFTATDAAADHLTLVATEWKEADDAAFTPGLPAFFTLHARGCDPDNGLIRCIWELRDDMGWPDGDYTVRLTVEDDVGHTVVAETSIQVGPEDASVSFDADNPVGVPVAEAGGESGAFDVTVYVEETEPDEPTGVAAPGDIGNADVTVRLVPVGPGGSASPDGCTIAESGIGYDGMLTVICSFDGVPVNTYTAEVSVDGGYYEGYGEDVVTVYDPSLGFTTGAGRLLWPGTEDRTNFGYTMKYNKKGQRVQGSLLLIRHVEGDAKYRVKSNALEGLALGDEGPFGWASFSGKSTYLEPGWPEAEGNHSFTVYVEDHGEPGSGADRFWIEIKDKSGAIVAAMSMYRPASDHTQTLLGGNVVVPHAEGRR